MARSRECLPRERRTLDHSIERKAGKMETQAAHPYIMAEEDKTTEETGP
jgi:hypothetical protein